MPEPIPAVPQPLLKGYRTYIAIAAGVIIQIAKAFDVYLGIDEQQLVEALGTIAALGMAAYYRRRA